MKAYLFVLLALACTCSAHKVADDEDSTPHKVFKEGNTQESLFCQRMNRFQGKSLNLKKKKSSRCGCLLPLQRSPRISTNVIEANKHLEMVKYQVEVAGTAFIFVTIVYFLKGKGTNQGIAKRWLQANSKLLSDNFYHLGFEKEPSATIQYTILINFHQAKQLQ